MDESTRMYLKGRGLDTDVVTGARLGHVTSPLNGHEYLLNRLVIPYIGPKDNVYNLRFRCMDHEDCKAEGCNSKYMSLPGFPSRVFNVRALVSGDDELHVTEGELDAVTLTACGLSAVGIPGVENLPAHFSRLVAGFSSVTLYADGDAAGRALAGTFTKAVPNARVISMPSGDDVNSVFVRDGKEGILRLLRGDSR
jgi:hypothetical protein